MQSVKRDSPDNEVSFLELLACSCLWLPFCHDRLWLHLRLVHSTEELSEKILQGLAYLPR